MITPTIPPTIRVLLVDDQSLLRMGFRMILEAEEDIEVVGEAGDGRAAVEMASALNPDVVLMDVRMPGTDGIQATAGIIASGSTARVLILTTFDVEQYALDGLRAGASGFLLNDVPAPVLVAAIRTVSAGESVLASTATRRLITRLLPLLPTSQRDERARELRSTLTDREFEVFTLVAAGRSNREIADELHLAEGTVKIHVGRILAKFDLRDRVQAVVLAYESGLVTPSS